MDRDIGHQNFRYQNIDANSVGGHFMGSNHAEKSIVVVVVVVVVVMVLVVVVVAITTTTTTTTTTATTKQYHCRFYPFLSIV